MRLRTRLALLVGAVLTVTVALVTITVSSSARDAFAALDAQRSAAAIAQFRSQLRTETAAVARRLERLAASNEMAHLAADISAAGGDLAPFVDAAARPAAAEGLDFFDIVAADGTIVSSAHWPARFGYRHAFAQDGATRGEAFLHPVEMPDDTALGLVASRRVASPGRALIVAGGRWLNAGFLKSLGLPPGMRALLYRNTQPEVSRRLLVGEEIADAAPLEPLIARVRQSGEVARERIEWPDGPEMVEATPLPGRMQPVLGVLLVGASERALAALVRRVRLSGLGFAALGVGIGFGVSYVFASRITRPVERLADASRQIAAGDWDVRVEDVPASGEIAALGQAFDTMTRQLVDQRERLLQAERVAAWRELARRLAHELKNPLFPLRLTLDNLRRAKPLPPAEFDEVFDESVGTLTTGMANLGTVVARFSDFARMPPPQLARVSLNAIVEESVALFRAQLAAPGAPPITVALDLAPGGAAMSGDAEQLGRAIQNLLVNAIDAMPSGGRLTVRTRRSGATIELAVADSGQGLTDEECRRLFTPYYTTKPHGTGLGLAIVQSVVADHQGRIRVESAPGRGATFLIELPGD